MDAQAWLRSACAAYLAEIHESSGSSAADSTSSLDITIADIANTEAPIDWISILQALSDALAVPSQCSGIARHFWPVLPDLIARWIGRTEASLQVWEARLAAVAQTCASFPHLWPIANAFLLSSPFFQSPLSPTPTVNLLSRPSSHLFPLLLAHYRLLSADPALPERHTWKHEPLLVLASQHADVGIRLLTVRVLSRQMRWSETKRMQLEREYIGDINSVDAPVTVGRDMKDGAERDIVVDGWLLGIVEAKRIEQLHAAVSESSKIELSPLKDVLCPRVALIGNALFLRSAPAQAIPFVHVQTQATENALRALVPILQTGSPALLSSTPSSGKTHLLHHLSTVLYPSTQPTHRILSIPLADTTIDVKSLIGTYVSSPTKPGTFEWMEGALAKAVRAGRWVVLDDIDRASMEMLVTVAGLARSLRPGRAGRRARLQVPGRPDIEAGDGFAVFATRSTRPDAMTPPAFFGHHHFTEVTLEPPSEIDILAILSAQFGRVPEKVISTLVSVWQDLRPLARVPGPVKPREIGLRDLEKWCARVQRNLPVQATIDALHSNPLGLFANPVFQDEVLLEAVDVFMASFDSKPTSTERRAGMIAVVAEAIGMDDDRALALIEKRRPTLEVSQSTRQLLIGRTVTPLAPAERKSKSRSSPGDESRPFALTKPSLILLERVAASTAQAEPTLLVGETGTGKTTAVQYIATACGKPLTALNLSMQTESSDLLGGFKPIDAGASARLLQAKWQKLFIDTFSMAKPANGTYLEIAAKALAGRKWARCADLWSSSARKALDKLVKKDDAELAAESAGADGIESPRKKRKTNVKAAKAAVQWQALMVEIADFDLHHVKMNSKLVFSFIEGPLVKAIQSGEWILLDEINLASQETLEAIATILEGPSASLVLTERGDVEPIKRHPEFRLFACMNPATDVGKKDLPPSLRTRFTELYVPPPDDDREALVSIVTGYIGDVAAGDRAAILDVAEMYLSLKKLSADKEIVDGANAPPHFSMRTLARALSFAVETAPLFGLRRGLWEGCLMAFTMSLDQASIERARGVCSKYLLGPLKNAKAVLSQIPQLPASADADDYVRFGAFWLKRGPVPPVAESRYVITPSVQAKLSDLARVILTHRYPVLIQGPTSAGKTSAVEFLARQTGHRFVRINNHEHTDIQEYLGTYVTDPKTGSLVFQEGLLVTAVRQGHWIVLDELNLAPTDVLEALNRLLDDNRELVIPETQEIIKPHPNFILFATQNPPGLYAGRKVLSRAFRNRFLEVHFDDVPKNELETILCQRCQIAPSYAKKIVQVFEELRHRRQASRVFESKSSFATLRDLFRWAERGAVGYQQLAEDGYMLLAERGRNEEDKEVIKGVIEDVMKVKVDQSRMYDLFSTPASSATISTTLAPESATPLSRLPFDAVPPSSLVWTKAMQRLFTLVASALAHQEPVLLVGETGCGKTSVCDIVAAAFAQSLVGVNCHQNMETADLLGSQRPVRNRLERKGKIISRLNTITPVSATASDDELAQTIATLLKDPEADHALLRSLSTDLAQLNALFEWSDGPLVGAMHAGDLLLLDEVSLADDSVLERLNSVLEPGRTLVLAEKGGNDIDAATIVAHDNFHVVATMNPGGDFGKKELSPALRNRFTEIWVPALTDRADLLQIIGLSWKVKGMEAFGGLMLDFMWWFCEKVGDAAALGLRDILAWVDFMNRIVVQNKLSPADAFHHGGQMVVVDGLESLPQTSGLSSDSMAELRRTCMDQLTALIAATGTTPSLPSSDMIADNATISIGGFAIHRGALPTDAVDFRFNAPTTAVNAMRVLRGCQLPKAILLEGSPGVGKTSLVAALAAVSGHRLQRINLSDQTDLIDLFGSDLPVEGGQPGEFQWRDAAFLDAMQKGDWVLLDEMNLASQTVLEGLNAVLDHRGTVYIPELGRSFDRHPDFRVFAAQNPLQQGGGRKGLPKSFLNRFTKVYLSEHTAEDLLLICQELHPLPTDMVQKMIRFNEEIRVRTMVTRTIGREGSPWEFNLRDLFRWFGLLSKRNGLEASLDPVEFLRMVYLNRFRNIADRQAVQAIFRDVFALDVPLVRPAPFVSPSAVQIGHSTIARGGNTDVRSTLQHAHLDVAESVLKAVEMGWLVILAGDSGSGKRHLLEGIAQRAGRELGEFAMHPGVDTSEILGSFEQQDMGRLAQVVNDAIEAVLDGLTDAQSHIALTARDALRPAFAAVSTDAEAGASAFLSSCTDILTRLSNAMNSSALVAAGAALAKFRNSSDSLSGFAWIDGQLVKALRTGGWFLISEANLCSASVLDRLNSLCENNGSLVLSEKGSATGTPEIISPHDGFRLFMTYDPRYGELSRAMRNRGIELHVSRPEQTQAATPIALEISSLERSAATITDAEQQPSFQADALAATLQEALPVLKRVLAIDPTHAAAARALQMAESAAAAQDGQAGYGSGFSTNTIDPSIHLSADRFDAVFRILQLYLRLEQQHESTKLFIQDPENAKSVIVRSAIAASGGRRKDFPGKQLYPFLEGMREVLVSALTQMLAADGAVVATGLDGLGTLLRLVEHHAKSAAFDYSATNLLAEWVRAAVEEVPALSTAASLVNALGATMQLTSGLAQTEVWNAFRDTLHSVEMDAEFLAKIESVRDIALRKSLINALISLRQGGSPEDVAQLQNVLGNVPEAPLSSTVTDVRWRNNGLHNLITLDILASRQLSPLPLLHGEPSIAVATLADLQVAAAGSSTSPALSFKVLSSWLEAVWCTVSRDDKALGGPADLLGPAQLRSVLRFESSDMIRMHDLPDLDAALRFSVESILQRSAAQVPRAAELLQLAIQTISHLLSSCVAHPLNAVNATELLQHCTSLSAGPLAKAVQTNLIEPLAAIGSTATETAVGDVYLGTSALLIELYVTNVPIDPSVRRILEGELLDAAKAELQEELQAVEAGENRRKGVSDSHRRARVLERIARIESTQIQLGPLLARQSDPVRLAQLFAEVHAFLGDIMSPASIASIRAALSSGHGQALAREWSLQAAADAFILRMSTIYVEMDDLVRPVVLAVQLARLGMRCLARDLEKRQHRSDPAVAAALRFPLTQTAAEIADTTAFRSENLHHARSALLSAMSTCAGMLGSEQKVALSPVMHAQLDSIYQIWSDVRTKEQHDEQAKESLYRAKKTDIEVESDPELEAKELAELFPTYENLDELPNAREKEDDVVGRFMSEDISAFHALVKAASTESPDKVIPQLQQSLRNLVKTNFDHRAYGDELDRASIAYQVDILHRRLAASRTQAKPPNFYLDANEPEIRKAHELVSTLHRRLTMLIDDWPEQMVLQHIRERVEKFLALDIRSPVALVLSALEQLLQHTDDWEPYASRDNSLRVFRADASAQIINWRKLELSSWNRLLDDQAEQYVAKDEEWTIRLYGSFISAAKTTDDISKHIDTILPMLSTYLQHSTMGHFVSRLDILASLAQIAAQATDIGGPSSSNLMMVSTVLSNVIANTRLIAPKIESHIQTTRAAVDKSIKDFIKLASWKDVNIHALRASAQKSHRQLHKNVRKFRELLSSPVAPFLGDVSGAIGQETPQTVTCLRSPIFSIEDPSFPDAVAADGRPAHLINLADTFARFTRVHTTAIETLPVKVGEDIDGMAIDIIETAAELAKATPSSLTKENAKIVNNLASRKRKAFADMLKALRSSGFSNNVRADALARQHSTTWLAQRPVLDLHGLPESFGQGDVQRIAKYHTKLNALMIALRAAFNGHNPDIASQDLQRGIGFAESIFACALMERDRIITVLSILASISAKIARLRSCRYDTTVAGQAVYNTLSEAAVSCGESRAALIEVETAILKHRELERKTIAATESAALRGYVAELGIVQGDLEALCTSARESSYFVFGRVEVSACDRYRDIRGRLIEHLQQSCDAHPDLRYLYSPVLSLASNAATGVLPQPPTRSSQPSITAADDLIQAMLVVTQSLKAPVSKDDEEEPERPHVPRAFTAQRSALEGMHIGSLLSRLDHFIGFVSEDPAMSATTLPRIMPFLETLSETYAQTASVHVYTVKSTYKLCYVVGRVMLDLAQKGFCKPQEESDSQDDGDADGQMTDGTGIGAGSGDKNVSNEIEEEGQVEGLQGEKEEDGEREEKEGDDDAFEMENDFEGDLEDGKEGEEGEGEEDGEEEERDDHAGDVDPLDPGAVDEKFWGDEEEQEGKDGGDEVMDQQAQQEAGESEMTAKDDKQKQDGKKDKEKEKDQEMGESAPEGGEEGEEDKFEEYDDGEEQDAPAEEEGGEEDQARPDQPNVSVPEGDKLDLPEDINLDGDESGSEMEAEDDMDLPGDDNDDDDERNNDQGDDIDMASQDDGEQAEDAPAPTGVGEDETEEQEEAMAQNVDLSASNDAQAQEAAEKGQGAGGQSEQQLEKEDADKEQQPETEQAEQAEEAEPQGQGAAQDPSSGPTDQNQGEGSIDSSGAPLPTDPSSAPQQNRSLGDIMQEIRRRQDEILAQQEREREVEKREDAQAEAAGQVEYLHDGDEDQGQQALGAAGEEDRQRLEDLNIVDEDEQAEANRGPEDMDIDEDGDAADKGTRPDESHRPAQPADAQPAEKALTQSDVMGGREAPIPSTEMDMDVDEGEAEAKTDVKEEVKEEDIKLTLIEQPAISDVAVNADEQWRYYAGLTSDLSYALCEQLRLILEPTLATRLQGDFRTGKRLNMRKIIPYIASEYTKDKIWLRRTKPSRREYQVLLSLDDSRSMSESHSVDLAYQTLALVSQALNKLEVGQIGIAKFGEGVDILHPFGDAGFTDADGAKVMSSFKFDQQKTDVAALVERTLTFLSESRQKQSSTSAPDLWQLQIIISDGVCQDHHRLRTLLRRALEERVMIVFLVIDSLRQTDAGPVKPATNGQQQHRPSILSMQTVEYKNVNGEMQLEMTRYLDTFPFEYYVVLRDVEALPGVLSDTLRQWMARVSQSQE